MSEIPVSNVRSFTILGHSGSGKTALTDALAFKLGLNDRLGEAVNGTSVSDTTDEEKSRKTTIFASPFLANYSCGGSDYRLVFTDTPGAPGFYGQVRGAVRAADFALIMVDASSGIEAGTVRSWRICTSHNLSAIAFVITGLDKEGASFKNAVEAIRDAFGNSCCPVTAPTAEGVVSNIIDKEDLPDDLAEVRTYLAESAAETSEELMNEYFEKGTLPPTTIRSGLHAGISDGSIHPIYSVNPITGLGLTEMLDSICRLISGPGSRPFMDVKANIQKPDPKAPFVAQVWRTEIDTFVGQLSFIRILSGTLTPGMALQDNTTGSKEIASSLLEVVGRKQIPMQSAGPGEIVALPKLKNVRTGDTLCAVGTDVVLPEIDYPKPVMFMSITAKTQADEDKLGTAMKRLTDSDPTLAFEKNEETKEVLIKGLGDVHLDLAVSLMKSQSNVSVELATPKIAYRETVQATGEGHYRHKKQTGGRGQFGEVYLRVMPLPEGETDWFVDSVVGGAIPNNFIPAVEKGAKEGLQKGAIAGYPVTGVRVEVYDGSFHPVDSSEVAFKIAASRAFREAMSKASPSLLEPVMTIKVEIPDRYMGAITGDLNHRRGRVLGMEMVDELQVVTAEVPMAELFQYPAQLRSLTGGRGNFEMDFARYEPVPAQIVKKIAESRASQLVIEDE